MKNKNLIIGIFTFFSLLGLGLNFIEKPKTIHQKNPAEVLFYLTKPDKSVLFQKQESGIAMPTDNSLPAIEALPGKTFQKMDGFGFTLTGGSAFHINNMSAAKRHELLTELFAFDKTLASVI